MPIPHDRDYYRCLTTAELLALARDEGINPEMAVAMAERLSEKGAGYYGATHAKRGFEFNFNHGGHTK